MDEREFHLEHLKASAQEREAVNRLYYGFWIVFLGGFALSLRVGYGKHVFVAETLLIAFRLLAVVGTAINFWMQYHALRSSSFMRMTAFHSVYSEQMAAKAA